MTILALFLEWRARRAEAQAQRYIVQGMASWDGSTAAWDAYCVAAMACFSRACELRRRALDLRSAA